jgi:prepilin-type N-terminal cleavage/methylation domain-containing protein
MIFAIKHRCVTFIELLIVIAIIGIIAGITLPNFKKTYSSFELDSFVKDVSYLARYLQSNSISYNRICRMDIEQFNERMQFKGLIRGETGEFNPVKGKFGKAYEAPAGITVSSLEPNGRNSIFFYPDGTLDKTDIVFKNKYGKETKLALKGSGTSIQIKD